MSGAVDIEHRLLGQGLAEFFVTGGQRGTQLLYHLDQVSATELEVQHIVQESLDATVGHVAGALLVTDQGRQSSSDQARLGDLAGKRRGNHLACPAMAVTAGTMLGDFKELFHQLGLLQDPKLVQRFPLGTQAGKLVDLCMVDLFRRKERSHMPG